MRIAVIRTPEVPRTCGAGITAASLAAAGHTVRVFTDIPDDPDLAARAGSDALRVQPWDAGQDTALAAAWSDDPPQVVHAIGLRAGVAAAATGVPVVQVYPPDAPGPAVVPAARTWSSPGVARVLASSEEQHTALLRRGVPRAALRTVPTAVDTDAFTPDGPALRRGDRPRLLAVGSLADGAGVDTVIRALARIRTAELLVAGGAAGQDPDRARLFDIAREAGVAGRVRFLGPVEGALLPRLLRSADVVVAAPEHDVGVGAVLQAMACARPVVATGVGGLRDVVVDGVTGMLVRPARPAELAVALRGVLGDDALRVGFGIAGRDRAVSRFDRVRIAQALTAVYGELVGEPVVEPAEDDDPEARTPVGAVG
ncbi:glycosyltransferase family 4 protein [Pseudonocardia sp. EV170527-09]|uniref:glycosyltransferase family 4 protein n=1 Tax=Pseudonocardia sp. EV170527-09 TaxID=2603411 RepID=UPI0011F2E6DE|nr:glycosyltransferase family 4 protein [Pseudonocardia sp. EV170527-09]KAA1024435.1 glycosyltransferase family 4 protein [Pseudonocardia sp. EV170527-09]